MNNACSSNLDYRLSLPLIETLGRGYVSLYIRTEKDGWPGINSVTRSDLMSSVSNWCIIGLTTKMHEHRLVTYMPPTSKFNILMMRLLLHGYSIE